ncbi:hypothetical protein K505DRAFT_191959, partial [Melanomma pulvis-pyrius CBS 109.77]
LPAELLLELQTFLSYASRVALRCTCRDLYNKVEHPTTSSLSNTRAYGMIDLLEIERWPEYHGVEYVSVENKQALDRRDFFACCLCLRIRSAGQFSNAMMRGKRGKLGNGTIADRIGRFCLTCGVTSRRYPLGTRLQFGGASQRQGLVCVTCGRFDQ